MMTGVRSDGNGGLIFSKGLVWVLGLSIPVIFTLVGFGFSQLVSIATLRAQVQTNVLHIEELQAWGPKRGDRYTAIDARAEWQAHATVHIDILTRMTEEFRAMDRRLAGIEAKLE